MKKVGIMGGTFNPIHISHLLIADRAYAYLGLDKVLFMPSKLPPHKAVNELAAEKDRVEMIKEAIKDHPNFEFSDFELKRDGLTYTADTLTLLKKENPETRYYFIIGGDSIEYFEKWNNPQLILENCVLVCAPRASEKRLSRPDTCQTVKGTDSSYHEYDYAHIINRLCKMFTRTREDGTVFNPEIVMLPSPLVSISSSGIREHIKCGLSIGSMVPKAVEDYIVKHGLYLNPEFEEIKARQKEYLKPKRFNHVLNVAATAYKLAMVNCIDPLKAYKAGLLHDCAKHLNDCEILKEAEKYNIEVDDVERRNASNLLHSKVGSKWAKEKFGIDDEEIMSAIYYHTTGRPEMTGLEMVLYLADILEPGRDIEYTPSLDVIRAEATYDLELAVYHVLNNVVPYLLENYKENVCMTTVYTYEYYKKRIENRNK